jgi:hypothetical protein
MREWNYRAAALWLIIGSASAAAQLTSARPSSADPVWVRKPATQWTVEDAEQLLERSPWSREIPAAIARRETEDQLREGGRLGQPTGVGYDGVDPKGSGPTVSPNIFTGKGGDDRSARSRPRGTTVRICWESALPVRLAELKAGEVASPTIESDGYKIAVYGIPAGANYKQDPKQLGDPLKRDASLKRDGQKDVKPTSVEVFQRQDGLEVVYVFPLSAEITRKDGHVRFEAQIGRVIVAHTFDLSAMEFLGKLEL